MKINARITSRLKDDAADILQIRIRTPDFQSRSAGHPVAQGLHALGADIDPIDMEELDVRYRAAVHLLKDLGGVRSLDLETVMGPVDGLAIRP